MRYTEIIEGYNTDGKQLPYCISVQYKNRSLDWGHLVKTFWAEQPSLQSVFEFGKTKTILKVEVYEMLDKPVNGVPSKLYMTFSGNQFNRDGIYCGENNSKVEFGPFENVKDIPHDCSDLACWEVKDGRLVKNIR